MNLRVLHKQKIHPGNPLLTLVILSVSEKFYALGHEILRFTQDDTI